MFNLFSIFSRHNDKSDALVKKMRVEVRKELKQVIIQQKQLKKAYEGLITKDLLKAMGARYE